MNVALGDIVKDTVTGFKGVVVCVSQWLNGCNRITIQPQGLKNGKPIETETMDEEQLTVVSQRRHIPSVTTGGPRPNPIRR